MALLSGMMRTVAVTGRTDHVHLGVADRQAGAWAERTMRGALPRPSPVATPPADPAETLRQLTQLHESGVLTDSEFESLRAHAGV
jgi:hypothetical protein